MENKAESTLPGERASFIVCRNSQGLEIQATLIRLTRYVVVFEIYSPAVILRMSEVLGDFKIVLQNRPVYSGKAVVSNLVNTGTVLVCEANLDECWIDLTASLPGKKNPLLAQLGEFFKEWQKTYTVLPEFKVAVADLQALFADMRLWMDQVELPIRSAPKGDRIQMEQAAALELTAPVLTAIDAIGDRFEEIAGRLDSDLRPAHIRFTRRQLHPLLLCSPFGHRTFHKPLGYAGDYEMVNMIVRNPYEGGSLFAKMVNAWFLDQLPAQGHRNRIKILKRRLVEETARIARVGRPAQIFNLGCGPAEEIREFLKEEAICDNAHLTLLDFNEETIQNTGASLREISRQFNRRTVIQMQKKSVQQVLKEAAKTGATPTDGKYDYLYCAGLFDYLPDRVCRQLMNVFYQWLAPGGLLLVTNVDGTRPFHNKLEFILDWNLIYRNCRQMMTLKPELAAEEFCSVKADITAVNVFLEIRKPENA